MSVLHCKRFGRKKTGIVPIHDCGTEIITVRGDLGFLPVLLDTNQKSVLSTVRDKVVFLAISNIFSSIQNIAATLLLIKYTQKRNKNHDNFPALKSEFLCAKQNLDIWKKLVARFELRSFWWQSRILPLS